MVTGGVNPIFIDTNILVYANQIQFPFHQAAIKAVQGFYDAGVEL
jgi:predicted nucleic acid-binding protein